MQTRSSTSANKAAPATIAAGGGRFIARGGKLAVPTPTPTPGLPPDAEPRRRKPGRGAELSDAQQLLMRDGALLDQTTRSCCAKAPASTIWRLPCRDRGGGPMSAQPTAASGAMGAMSATTLARSCCCCSFPAALVRCCRAYSPAASRSSSRSGHRCVGCSRSSSCSWCSRLQAAREDLDAPGRTIIVDPDPLEVRVESAALVPTMGDRARTPMLCPSNVPSTSTRQ